VTRLWPARLAVHRLSRSGGQHAPDGAGLAAPLAWRIVIAAALALAVLTFAQMPRASAPNRVRAAATVVPGPEPAAPAVPDTAAIPIGAEAARLSNAGVPIADLQPAAAAPFHFAGDAAARLRALDCLALAAWYEAGDDPSGERAVIQVVLNRVRHPAFPDGVCAVVFQGSERRTGCQFTFTCDGALGRNPASPALARARAIADAALAGAVDARVGLATHYHADYVVPRWRDELVKIAQDGAHLFYRWPGYWGSARAMAASSGTGLEAVEPAIAALSPAHAPQVPAIAEAPPQPAAPVRTSISVPPPPAAAPLEIELDPAAPPGSYALHALALCGPATDCRVAGRLARDIAFVYVRRGGSLREGAYWDCARFHRRDPAQCLPAGPALDRLLAAG